MSPFGLRGIICDTGIARHVDQLRGVELGDFCHLLVAQILRYHIPDGRPRRLRAHGCPAGHLVALAGFHAVAVVEGHVGDAGSDFLGRVTHVIEPGQANHVTTLLVVGVDIEQVIEHVFQNEPEILAGHFPHVGFGIGDGRLIHDVLHGDGLSRQHGRAPAKSRRQRDLGIADNPLRIADELIEGAVEVAAAIEQARQGMETGGVPIGSILVLDGGYHGNTSRLSGSSAYKFRGEGGRGWGASAVHVAPTPDGYRGEHKGQGREPGVAYGNEVGQILKEADTAFAAFLAEPILSCGGQIVPPAGFMETAFQHVRDVGAVCIMDEVQVGFGRVGTHFWGFETQNVVPDIVVMGKPIGNGHPMAAVVTSHEIADAFANGMEYFSTFGGNPVSCAIGLAVLDVIEEEQLQQRALDLGVRLREGLARLMDEFPLIGDVRGVGLFQGFELVRSRTTLEPAALEASRLVNRMRDRGFLLSTDGPLHNVIKIKPPMVLTGDDIDMTIRHLRAVLSNL